jgi:hypothetical protein
LLAEWRGMHDVDSATPARGDERLWANAETLVTEGVTSAAEVIRVLGLRRGT